MDERRKNAPRRKGKKKGLEKNLRKLPPPNAATRKQIQQFLRPWVRKGEENLRRMRNAADWISFWRSFCLTRKWASGWSQSWQRKGKTLWEKETFSEAVAAYTQGIRWNPQAADAWWERGKVLVRMREIDAAMEDFSTAILLNPEKADFYISRGSLLVEKGAYSAALADFQQALKLQPEEILVYYFCGKIYYHWEDYSLAEFCMNHVLEKSPDFTPARIRLGYCFLARREITLAVRQFCEAKKKLENDFANYPDFTDMRHFLQTHPLEETLFVDVCYGWIRCCGALEEKERGLQLCDEVLQFKPNSKEVRFARGELWLMSKEPENALKDFQYLRELDPDFGEAIARIGTCLRGLRRWEEAIEQYEEAKRRDVREPDVLVGWGICLQKLDRPDEAIAILTQAIAEYPQFAEGYYRRGISYYEKQQLPEAERDLRRAVRLAPQNPYYWKDLAMVCYVHNDVLETLYATSQALRHHPKLAEAHLLMAAVLRDTENYSEALQEVQYVLALDPGCVEGLVMLGYIQFHLEHLDEAIEAFTKALEITSEHPLAWSGRSSVYAVKQDWEKAIRDCQKAIELAPEYIRFQIHMVSFLGQSEKWEEALAFCQKMQEDFPDEAVSWVMMADIHMKMKHPEAAIVALDRALEKSPEEFDILQRKVGVKCSLGLFRAALDDLNSAIMEQENDELYLLRSSVHGKMECWQEALEDVSRAIEKNQDNLQAWYQRGMIWMMMRHYEEALADFEWVVQHDPEAVEPRFSKAFTLLGLFRTEEAFEEMEWILEIRPDFVPALCEKAILLASMGRKEEAITLYNEILHQFPNNARILNFRGTLLASKKHFTDALDDYNRAIEANPDFAPAYNNRGFIYYAKGELENALYNINTAIQLWPDWSRPYLNRAVLYLQMNDLNAAREDVAKAIARARDAGDEDTVVDALALRETIEDVDDMREDIDDLLNKEDMDDFLDKMDHLPDEFSEEYLDDLPMEIPEDFQEGLSQDYLTFELPMQDDDDEDTDEDDDEEDDDEDEDEDEDDDKDNEFWSLLRDFYQCETEGPEKKRVKRYFPSDSPHPVWIFQHAPISREDFYADPENFPSISQKENAGMKSEDFPSASEFIKKAKSIHPLYEYLTHWLVLQFHGMPGVSVLHQLDDNDNFLDLIRYLKAKQLLPESFFQKNSEKDPVQKRQEELWESYLQMQTDRITFESILEDLGDPHFEGLAGWEVDAENGDETEEPPDDEDENPFEKEE